MPLQVTIRDHTAVLRYTELNKCILACCLTVHRKLVNIFRHYFQEIKWSNAICWYVYESLSTVVISCLYLKSELQSLWQALGSSKYRSGEGYDEQVRPIPCPVLKGG